MVELVNEVFKTWPGSWMDKSDPHAVHEARLLQLNTAKAKALLDWSPVWSFPEAVRETIAWYRVNSAGTTAGAVHSSTLKQIETYCHRATALRVIWAIA